MGRKTGSHVRSREENEETRQERDGIPIFFRVCVMAKPNATSKKFDANFCYGADDAMQLRKAITCVPNLIYT